MYTIYPSINLPSLLLLPTWSYEKTRNRATTTYPFPNLLNGQVVCHSLDITFRVHGVVGYFYMVCKLTTTSEFKSGKKLVKGMFFPLATCRTCAGNENVLEGRKRCKSNWDSGNEGRTEFWKFKWTALLFCTTIRCKKGICSHRQSTKERKSKASLTFPKNLINFNILCWVGPVGLKRDSRGK